MGIDNRESVWENLSNEKLVLLIIDHFRDIKKVQWSDEKIQNQLGRRSIQDILTSQETCYMGSCVDMTLSFFMKLKEKYPDLQLSLWCEVLRQKKNWNLALHFFLKNENENQIIDFVRNNQVAIYHGQYANPWEKITVEHVSLFSLAWDQVQPSDSLLTLATKLWIPFSEKDFDSYLGKLKSDNTDQEFQDFSTKRSWLRIMLDGKRLPLSQLHLYEALQG